ncbi:hypothetical protein GCM10017788_65040 [Amycolatopsis acidiphila]|nr:hypothetical protein GCM10017788_65040 [Amycolatopsis acidiphila]
MLSDRAGLPLTVGISAANTHDTRALSPLVNALPPRTPAPETGQAARGQGLRHPRPARLAPPAPNPPAHRPQRHRIITCYKELAK